MLCTFAYICICMQYALTCHAAWHGKQQTKRSIRSFIHESVLSFIAHVGVYVYGLCICLQHVLILHRLPREAVNKCKETTVHLRPPTRLVKHGALDALTKQLTGCISVREALLQVCNTRFHEHAHEAKAFSFGRQPLESLCGKALLRILL